VEALLNSKAPKPDPKSMARTRPIRRNTIKRRVTSNRAPHPDGTKSRDHPAL
jgi:hypothetical protein